MKFQILHESRGRARLRAVQASMSMEQADILEAWLLALPQVDQVTVHERICGVIIVFHGSRGRSIKSSRASPTRSLNRRCASRAARAA